MPITMLTEGHTAHVMHIEGFYYRHLNNRREAQVRRLREKSQGGTQGITCIDWLRGRKHRHVCSDVLDRPVPLHRGRQRSHRLLQ